MWNVFFDTCELRSKRFWIDGVVQAIRAVEAQAYVPRLVVEERVEQEMAREGSQFPWPEGRRSEGCSRRHWRS
jgi:hypothetical protein